MWGERITVSSGRARRARRLSLLKGVIRVGKRGVYSTILTVHRPVSGERGSPSAPGKVYCMNRPVML